MLAPHRRPCDTPEARTLPAPAPAIDARWVLPATILGSSLSYVDESMINVALPAMQRDLGAGFATMQWVFNGYMLALASLTLLGGSASDRFGCRRIFLVGLAAFAAASLACALAPSAAWLVAARFAQGTAAALLMPASLALVSSAYTGTARGAAIGTWAASGAIAIALGRPLGGWLVDAVGWRAIFFVNLPLAAGALWLGFKLAAGRDAERTRAFDLPGALLAVLSLGLLSYGLIALGQGDGAAGALAVGLSLPAMALFVRQEARSPTPMLPLPLFRNAAFAGVNLVTALYYAALSGALFLLPYVLIEVHGYSALAAGAAFLPLSILMGGGSRGAGGLMARTGARLPLVLGPALTAAGYVLLGVSGEEPSYWRGFLPGLLVVAFGVTLTVAPLTTVVFDSSPAEASGTASGINNAVDVAGGLVAVAALGLAFGAAGAGALEPEALAGGYRVVMFAAAALAGVSAGVAALTIRAPRKA